MLTLAVVLVLATPTHTSLGPDEATTPIIAAAVDDHLPPGWAANEGKPGGAAAGWTLADGTRSMALLLVPQVPFAMFRDTPEVMLLRPGSRVFDRSLEHPDDSTFDLKLRYLSDEPRIRHFWARVADDGAGGSVLLSANTSQVVPATLAELEDDELRADQLAFLSGCDEFEDALARAGTMEAFARVMARVRGAAAPRPLEPLQALALTLALTNDAQEFGGTLHRRAGEDRLLERSTDRARLVFDTYPGVLVDTVASDVKDAFEEDGAESVAADVREFEFEAGTAREWTYAVTWADEPRFTRVRLRGIEIEGGTTAVLAMVWNSTADESEATFAEAVAARVAKSDALADLFTKLLQSFALTRRPGEGDGE